MPAMFTRSLATRLDGLCKLRVELGVHGTVLKPGHAYVIEGGVHGRVRRARSGALELEVGPEPTTALYKPSVNELMRTAGESCGHRALGVMLTGMGDDGLIGTKTLRERGGAMLAQDQASCVVWGMPRAVTLAGLIDAALPPVAIAACLAQLAASDGGAAQDNETFRRSA
jgi:two-component system chemotaxis response regulator CheB